MSLPVVVPPPAGIDTDEAVAWFDAKRPGLGREFLRDLDRLLNIISHYPECCQRFRGPLRRGFLQRFQYAIVYHVRSDAIVVVSITPCRMRPARRKPHLSPSTE